jgi:hypothetical protein
MGDSLIPSPLTLYTCPSPPPLAHGRSPDPRLKIEDTWRVMKSFVEQGACSV